MMMKSRMKAIVLVAALALLPLSAAKADNDVGCGVGTMIMEGQEGIPFKILASFTNGITFQSISITFGLLNCDGRGKVTASARTRHFAAASFDDLARDFAMGGGESLDALAALLEVDEIDRPALARLTQSRFDALFPHDQVTSNDMLETLDQLMREDARLSIYTQG